MTIIQSTVLFSVLTCAAGALASGCSDRQMRVARCVTGEQNTCACTDGHAGVQACNATGTFGACSCPPAVTCPAGLAISCTCSDGDRGTQLCNARGAFDPCVCAPPACIPDQTAACMCQNGFAGTQLCGANRSFEPCDCRADEEAHPPMIGVLDFPDPGGDVQTHVNHGPFWSTGANLGRHFFWDAWVAPRTSGTLVSDGYGTAHALRWGPVLQDGQLVFKGEFWTSGGPIQVSAAEGPAPGEWGHHAIDLIEDASILQPALLLYWNGICVGITTFAAVDRLAGVAGNGDGTLYVMGAPSQSLGGRLAVVRGFEQFSPFSQALPLWSFLPERGLTQWIGNISADFFADYTRRGPDIPDLSSGYRGGDASALLKPHPGTLENSVPTSGPPTLPRWVTDPEAPYGTAGQLPTNTHEAVQAPAPPPPGALVFDSFNRRGQNFVWQQVPTLGQTEAGSLGPRSWMTGLLGPAYMPAAFGIINGRAVFLEHQMGMAWVDVDTTDQDVRLDRFRAGGGHGTSGLAFRVSGPKTFGYLFSDQMNVMGPNQPIKVQLGFLVNGMQDGSVNVLTPPTDNWTRMRVVANAATVTAYVDDGRAGWTMIGTLSNRPPTADATGAGLTGAPTYLYASSLWRGDNFTVCAPGDC